LNFAQTFENSGRQNDCKEKPGVNSKETRCGLNKARQAFEVEHMLALRDLMRPVGEHNVLQPVCPICSRPLRLARGKARNGGRAEPRTYGCTGCGVWLTEAAQNGHDSVDDSAD
jgi:hypothetical protein